MTKRTAKETADNEEVDRRNERIYREMYREEMKARESGERERNDDDEREMAKRYFKKTDLSIHQRTIKLIARRHASVGDRPRFSMPSATKLCPPLSLFSLACVYFFLTHERFKLFPERKENVFSFPLRRRFCRRVDHAIIRARMRSRDVALI